MRKNEKIINQLIFMWKKYRKSRGYKKPYKKKKNYYYNKWKIKDSDIWMAVWIIVTIVVAFILKVLFWISIILWIVISAYSIYKILTSYIWEKLKTFLILLILFLDIIWVIFAFEKQDIVYNKIDNIASDIWWFFGYKKWKIVVDPEWWVENIIQNQAIENLQNNNK